MPKYVANRVGTANTTILSDDGGIFNMFDVYQSSTVGGWVNIPVAGRITIAGGTPHPAPDAEVYVWTSPGSLTLAGAPAVCDYIVVGGGGGGGNANWAGSYNAGGGGGAGGFRTGTVPAFPAGPWPITIGSGGAPPPGGPLTPVKPTGTPGVNGSPTSWYTITSYGGGAGGGGAPGSGFADGIPGGSGGGNGGYGFPVVASGDSVTGTATPAPPQGSPGNGTAPAPAGGGGGAGGIAPTLRNGGPGLSGFSGSPNIPPAYGTPEPTAGRWFSGGGGAGYGPTGAPGSGGAGGGGTGGGVNSEGGAASGHGGGGGGAGRDSPGVPSPTKNRGGTGSPGIVILRFPY